MSELFASHLTEDHLKLLAGAAAHAAELLDPTPSPYLHDPLGWIEARCDEKVWAKPAELAMSVVKNRYTVGQACHDVGKSHIVSRLAGWWIDVHPPGEALVITTAPTWHQVASIIWEELKQVHEKAGLPGRITEDAKWKIPIGDRTALVGFGRKPADTNPTGFSGQHRRYVLVIIDEAVGVPAKLWDALDSLVTNEHCRVIAIGNPDDPTSHMESICKSGSGWHVVRMNALESPNFTEERIAPFPRVRALMEELGIQPSTEEIHEHVRDLLVSPLWVHERILRWGIDSPTFVSKVLGQFPDENEDTLFPQRFLRAAQARDLPGYEPGQYAFDIANTGPDETCGYRNRGGHLRLVLSKHRQELPDTENDIERILKPHGGGIGGWIDCDGIGSGVYQHLRRRNVKVWEYRGSAAAYESKRFVNRRAEATYAASEAFQEIDSEGVDLDPLDEDVVAQLGRLKRVYGSKGRILVESKADMKKRGLPSPDRADAAIMALQSEPIVWSAPTTPARTMTNDLLSKAM